MNDPGRTRRIATYTTLTAAILGSIILQAGPSFDQKGGSIHFSEWRLWNWYIEDAAISFAYARNWVEGAGLAAFRGGERIEGFSNPTWVGLMAIWELFGVDGFTSSKIMALVLSSVTIVMSWFIAREVIDDEDSWAPLMAPVLLACFPQFAFWNASGLENPLITFLMAGAFWRAIVEAKRGGYPWSAAWFTLLAMSRPEMIMYAAWGGFASMIMAFRNGQGVKSTAQWLFTFFVPFSVYQAVRYDYFAWAFPNTYYAKLGDQEFKPFAWESRGWKYIRAWGWDTGTGWFTPVILSGLIGLRGLRRWAVPVVTLAMIFLVIYPSSEMTSKIEWWPKDLPAPDWWKEARVWALLGTALAAMVAAFPDRRAFGRVLAWGSILITFFFCVRANGDWMKGYRWMNFVSIPGVLLLTCGIEELAALFQRTFGRTRAPGWSTPGWVTATVLTLGVMPGWFIHSAWFIGKRETGPYSVEKRVDYTEFLMTRTWEVDKLVKNFDVDMGAHLWWSKHEMVDMAGLVDVSIAHHDYKQRDFVEEYMYKEQKAEIAHVHGGWANTSKIPTYPEWKRDYIGMPAFPMSARVAHVGNFMRRDVFMSPTFAGAHGREVAFDRGIVLSGFDVPSPEISPGKALYIEVSASYRALDAKENFRFLMFLADHEGHLQTVDIPVGYDWLPPTEWRMGEVWTGKFAFAIDKALTPGDYDLGFVAIGADGAVVPLATAPAVKGRPGARLPLPDGVTVGGDPDVAPRFARGEVVFPSVVKIGAPETGEKAARADVDRAADSARADQCDEAAASWRLARAHIPNATKWLTDKRALFAVLEAECYARAALVAAEKDPADAVPLLEAARVWTWKNNALFAAQAAVGQQLYDRGMKAREAQDWEKAYLAFDGAVRANPSLSWARRYAEEARDLRLGLTGPESAAPAPAATPKPPRPPRPANPGVKPPEGAAEDPVSPEGAPNNPKAEAPAPEAPAPEGAEP